MKYKINHKNFNSKIEVINHFKVIFNKYIIYDFLNFEDKNDVLALLELHPNKQSKIGRGIREIQIGLSEYKNKCFIIHRIDSTMTDFSFLKCLNGESLDTKIKKACREAIKEYIFEFRKQNNNFDKSYEVHHEITFKQIFNEWIKKQNITENDLNQSSDKETTTYFVNENLKQSFIDFHNSKSKLILMDKKEHRLLKK